MHRLAAVSAILPLIVAIAFVLAPSANAQGTIELGMLMPYDADPQLLSLAASVKRGADIAFDVINRAGGPHGMNITVKEISTAYTATNYTTKSLELLAANPNIVAFFGIIGNEQIREVDAALQTRDMVHISPVAGAPIGHYFSETNLNVRPDPYAEMVAMSTAIASNLRLKRVAFHYAKNAGYGEEFFEQMTPMMRELGIEWTHVVAYDPADPNFSMEREVTQLMFAEPDAIVSWGRADAVTAQFFITCLAHPLAKTHAANMKFVIGEVLVPIASYAFTYADTELGLKLSPKDRIYSTFTLPVATDTSYQIVRSAQASFTAALGPNWLQQSASVAHLLFGGYVVAHMANEVLRKAPLPLTPAGIKASAFQSSIYEVEDLLLGVYNSKCTGRRTTICECNNGGKFVEMGVIQENFVYKAIPEAQFSWPLSTCSSRELTVRQPTNYLQLHPSGVGFNSSHLLARMVSGKESADNTSKSTMQPGNIATRDTPTSFTDITREVQEVNTTLMVTLVGHSVVHPTLAAASAWPIVDPFYPSSVPAGGFARRMLRTTSTVEQELHALVHYTSSALGEGSVHLGGAASVVASLEGPFKGSCRTFGVEPSVSGSTVAGIVSSSNRFVILVGVESSDVAAIAAALVTTPTLRVALLSDEAAAIYPDLASLASTDRIMIATSLPSWSAAGASTSQLVSKYHTTLANASDADLLSFRSFVSTRAVELVVNNVLGQTTPENFLRSWYKTSFLFLDDEIQLGPYFDDTCNENNAGSCECNVGPRRVNVHSLGTVLQGLSRTPAYVELFSSCRVVYFEPEEDDNSLSMGAVIGIVVGVVAAAFVVAVLIMRARGERNVVYAPKDASKPYTLVFTDIQASTSLWARVPNDMGPALDVHHAIIRELIAKHHGYEVKTIGDAFMIAFSSADDAVSLCCELQERFLQHEWGTHALDDTYRQLERELLEDDPQAEAKAPTCKLPAALYDKVWCGLRVRCGLHTGIGEIKFDEVSRGYDYYGNVPNVAARTEAIANGGQIIMTVDTANSLKKQVATTDLGAIELRGVTNPVQMLQIEAIKGRAFAPLRLDRADDNGSQFMSDGTTTTDTPAADDALSVNSGASSAALSRGSQVSGAGGIPEENVNFHEALKLMLSTVDAPLRVTTLRKVAEKWRISVPRERRNDDSFLTGALSKRVLSVYQNKFKKARETMPVMDVSLNSHSGLMSNSANAPRGLRRQTMSPTQTNHVTTDYPGLAYMEQGSPTSKSFDKSIE